MDARLAEIRAASAGELAVLVGDAWLANADTVCRGLSWTRSSVRHLQAVAAGLGGPAVAAILAALCLNHKHFGGGLPDLLLMRAVRIGGGADAVAPESGPTTASAEGAGSARGAAAAEAGAAVSLAFDVEEEVSTVSFESPRQADEWY